jgi:hypothetical protein
MTECRANIVMTYAGWTALSALRSGAPIKSRAQVYPLLRSVDFRVLLSEGGPPVTPAEFAAWHRRETLAICRRESALCVGWATKLLNVYLKTAAYIGGLGRPRLTTSLHPPIDGGLWGGLGRRFAGRADVIRRTHVVRRIKDIRDYRTYETIIAGCRQAASELGCLLIEVEQLWEGASAPSANRGHRTTSRFRG